MSKKRSVAVSFIEFHLPLQRYHTRCAHSSFVGYTEQQPWGHIRNGRQLNWTVEGRQVAMKFYYVQLESRIPLVAHGLSLWCALGFLNAYAMFSVTILLSLLCGWVTFLSSTQIDDEFAGHRGCLSSWARHLIWDSDLTQASQWMTLELDWRIFSWNSLKIPLFGGVCRHIGAWVHLEVPFNHACLPAETTMNRDGMRVTAFQLRHLFAATNLIHTELSFCTISDR